jgi:hypothetical protein
VSPTLLSRLTTKSIATTEKPVRNDAVENKSDPSKILNVARRRKFPVRRDRMLQTAWRFWTARGDERWPNDD